MKKRISELKTGEVIRTEYGIEGQFVTVEIVDIERLHREKDGKLLEAGFKMTVKNREGMRFDMYAPFDDKEEIIENGWN